MIFPFEVARHHVGQVGHVGRTTSNSKAYQRFSLPDMAFPMSGACRACRARPTSWGIMRDGWKAWAGCGPVGGMERRTPRRAAFPLAAGLSGHLCPACGLHAGRVRRHGRAGAPVLNRHAFEVARHHVGQVGHVGRTTSNSKAYQRFSLPDMAFPMSGACRACRARPTSWGIMRDGWKAWAGCGPVGGMERRTPRRAAFPLAAGLSGHLCPACGLHAGRVRRLLKHSSRNHIFRVILGEISSEDTYNVLIGVHF